MHQVLSHDELAALDERAFRSVVREWVGQNYPPELRNRPQRLRWAEAKPFYLKLSERGWLAPRWPREHGGMALHPALQIVMIEEFERHGVARLPDQGIVNLGPMLIQHGSQAQKQHFLPKILSGEHVWCQGYSEPNAGSDLASLRTSAVLDGDRWIVNGQKIWTTLASDANWIYLLVRTDPSARKHAGISFLLVPMDSKGVTVRPIRSIDLEEEFCEVFFDDVEVPRENIVGEINKGWDIAKSLLGFERVFVGAPGQSESALVRLERLAKALGIWDDPSFIERYVPLRMDFEDHQALFEHYVDLLRKGESIGPDVSILKIHQSELFQRITDALLEFSGEFSGRLDGLDTDAAINPANMFMRARPTTIYAGSSEVQRNIVAKHVLRLPD